jgi:hypothetical protein
MKKLTADRRLYLTVEKDRVVEEGDDRGAWLLYAVGRVIGAGDVELFDMKEDDFGRVIYEGCPRLPPPEAEVIEDLQEDEDGEEEAGKVLAFGGGGEADDSDRNDDPVLEWPGRMGPKAYLKRYPTGPKAELAAAVIAAQDDGADGES